MIVVTPQESDPPLRVSSSYSASELSWTLACDLKRPILSFPWQLYSWPSFRYFVYSSSLTNRLKSVSPSFFFWETIQQEYTISFTSPDSPLQFAPTLKSIWQEDPSLPAPLLPLLPLLLLLSQWFILHPSLCSSQALSTLCQASFFRMWYPKRPHCLSQSLWQHHSLLHWIDPISNLFLNQALSLLFLLLIYTYFEKPWLTLHYCLLL